MKRSVSVLITASILIVGSAAHAGDAGVDSAISAFGTAFNKGDISAAKATMEPSVMITDEVAPYAWNGPAALDTWLADLAKSEAAEGKTGGVVAIEAPTRELVTGDSAYAIVPATYTFKQKGAMMRETAQMTFAMAKTPAGWRIAGWTWTGPNAVPLR